MLEGNTDKEGGRQGSTMVDCPSPQGAAELAAGVPACSQEPHGIITVSVGWRGAVVATGREALKAGAGGAGGSDSKQACGVQQHLGGSTGSMLVHWDKV